MAFPFTFEEEFELSTLGNFDSETDTGTKLDIAHYTTLAAIPGTNRASALPYRGAYCMRVDHSSGTTEAYLQEDTGFDVALAGSLRVGFYLWVGGDITMAVNDRFTIFAMTSGAAPGTDQVVVDIRNNAGVIEILASQTGASATVRAADLPLNRWNHIALNVTIDSGVPNDGTIDFFLNGTQIGAQITALDQAAIAQALIGMRGIDAGTTRAYMLFDQIRADDGRLYPFRDRRPLQFELTIRGHVFVGPGRIDSIALMAGAATDNVLTVYDTDTANTNDADGFVVELKNTTNSEFVQSRDLSGRLFKRGCYVNMTGTNPRGLVKILSAPAYFSDGAMRNYANRRTMTTEVA